MTTFSATEYENLLKEYIRQLKCIANYKNRPLPIKKQPRTYVEELIVSYNNIRQYLLETESQLEQESRDQIPSLVNDWNEKLISHAAILRFRVEIPNSLAEIDKNRLKEINDDESELLSSSIVANDDSLNDPSEEEPSTSKEKIDDQITINEQQTVNLTIGVERKINSCIENPSVQKEEKMPQTKSDVIKLCAPTLNYKFSGESTKLRGFISDIRMLNDAIEAENKAFFLKLLKAKLEGKAIDADNEKAVDVETLITELEIVSKCESSKVIEGKLLSLKIDRFSISKFAHMVDELTEALKASYISEEYGKKKANELVIEKTVEVCRRQTKLDSVRSVLASSTFSSPAEVVAKLITEQNTVNKERRENYQNKSFGNKFKQKNQANGRNSNGNQNKNDYRAKNYNNGNNGNRSQSQQKNKNYNNNRRFNNSNRSNENVVRFIQGNEQRPSQGLATGGTDTEM